MPLSPALSGSLAALAAFSIWGFMPIYFKQLAQVPSLEILCHRIVWSSLLTLGLCLLLNRRSAFLEIMRQPKALGLLMLSAFLVGGNWLLFIWAINNNHLVEASLGYFINPLVNMLLGYLFLRERLTSLQQVAAALAVTGVMIKIIGFGHVPWIALGVAFSFGFYGLLRKQMHVESLLGLTVETTLLVPFAVFYFLVTDSPTMNWSANSWQLNALFLFAGPATTVPLLLFVHAGRRLTLTSLGFFQYLAPSCMFLLATGIYGEQVTAGQWWTFVFIWSALALVSSQAASRYWQRPADAPRA